MTTSLIFILLTENGPLTRIFHELIWTVQQGAGREAVVNLPRAACNTAEAFKVTRPKGEFFRHKNAA